MEAVDVRQRRVEHEDSPNSPDTETNNEPIDDILGAVARVHGTHHRNKKYAAFAALLSSIFGLLAYIFLELL